jgi:hypothetical protein
MVEGTPTVDSDAYCCIGSLPSFVANQTVYPGNLIEQAGHSYHMVSYSRLNDAISVTGCTGL